MKALTLSWALDFQMKFVGGKDLELAETERALKNAPTEIDLRVLKIKPTYPGKWMIKTWAKVDIGRENSLIS